MTSDMSLIRKYVSRARCGLGGGDGEWYKYTLGCGLSGGVERGLIDDLR
jgi:hypothetical protein